MASIYNFNTYGYQYYGLEIGNYPDTYPYKWFAPIDVLPADYRSAQNTRMRRRSSSHVRRRMKYKPRRFIPARSNPSLSWKKRRR